MKELFAIAVFIAFIVQCVTIIICYKLYKLAKPSRWRIAWLIYFVAMVILISRRIFVVLYISEIWKVQSFTVWFDLIGITLVLTGIWFVFSLQMYKLFKKYLNGTNNNNCKK